MKAILTTQNIASDVVLTWWTPIFVVIFVAIVAWTLWPRKKDTYDAAASMPLREE
jgi:cytochrome c oxidase cbb3-type subunit IV